MKPRRKNPRTPKWKFIALVREAIRNLAFSGISTALFIFGAVAVIVGVSVFEIATVQGLRETESAMWRSGDHVMWWSAEGGIDSKSCEEAEAHESVLASGALNRSGDVVLTNVSPDVSQQIISVTPGVLEIEAHLRSGTLSPRIETGLLASPEAATVLGLVAGERVHLSHSTRTSITTGSLGFLATVDIFFVNPSLRGPLIEVVTPTRPMSVCILLAQPGHFKEAKVLAPVLVRTHYSHPDSPQLSQLRGLDEFTQDPLSDFHARPSRLGWLLGGTGLAGAWMLLAVSKTRERGLYRAFGMSWFEVTLVDVVELLLVFVVALSSSVGVSLALARISSWPTAYAIEVAGISGLGVAGLACVIVAVARLLSRSISIMDMVKD